MFYFSHQLHGAIALSGDTLEWLTVFGYVGLAVIACWGVMFAPIRKD